MVSMLNLDLLSDLQDLSITFTQHYLLGGRVREMTLVFTFYIYIYIYVYFIMQVKFIYF
jgi:hypothetical protein